MSAAEEGLLDEPAHLMRWIHKRGSGASNALESSGGAAELGRRGDERQNEEWARGGCGGGSAKGRGGGGNDCGGNFSRRASGV